MIAEELQGVRERRGISGPWEETLLWGEVGVLGDGLGWE